MRGKLKRAGWNTDFLLDMVRAALQLEQISNAIVLIVTEGCSGTLTNKGRRGGEFTIRKTVPEQRIMGDMQTLESWLPLRTEKQPHLALLMQYWG